MKKIVVPVDFSVHSEQALEVAARIAKKRQAEMLLIHVLNLSDKISETDATERRETQYLEEVTQKRLEEFADKDFMKGIPLSFQVRKYKVFREVNLATKEAEADLIVMGSRGAEGIKGFFAGSNTSRVVQISETPVLVIKKQQREFTPGKIIFASDFAPENFEAFKKARDFARIYDAEIKLVYVNTPNMSFCSTRDIREKMREFLRSTEMPVDTSNVLIYNDYTVQTGILNAAEDQKADLIAIPTHGRTGFDRIISGNISGEVASQAAIPVFTIKVQTSEKPSK
jgi:nucleotide-binding universal stress UspA family protein